MIWLPLLVTIVVGGIYAALLFRLGDNGKPSSSCRSCAGSGRFPGLPYLTCPQCLGKGRQ